MQFVGLLQDFYAERLALAIIINANWVYKAAFLMIKPFLAKRTKEKIIIVGGLDDLLKYFEPT